MQCQMTQTLLIVFLGSHQELRRSITLLPPSHHLEDKVEARKDPIVGNECANGKLPQLLNMRTWCQCDMLTFDNKNDTA